MKSRSNRGFSLLEMMIVIAIGMTMAGVTFIAMMPLMNKSHVDNAYDLVLTVLRDTRHLAITQSHEYIVTFNPAGYAAGTMLVQYQPPAVGGGALPPLQKVNAYTLPSDMTFSVRTGFPASAPDGFGSGATAIDFGQGLGGGAIAYVAFMPDGSARDTLGNYNSGVVYISRLADTAIYNGSRSITVWGATGRVRGWRLYNPAGVATWTQQ